jgi:hypothetical protein
MPHKTTSLLDFNTCGHTPFSAFSLEYELTVSRRQNIVLLCVRFPTFWSPGRILDRLHEIPVHACRRRSHSFHVSYFYHPIGNSLLCNAGMRVANLSFILQGAG